MRPAQCRASARDLTAILLACGAAAGAGTPTTTWVAGVGAYNNDANWSDQVPVFGVGGIIDNGGEAQVSSNGSSRWLRIGGATTSRLRITANTLSVERAIYLGYGAGQTGELLIEGGSFAFGPDGQALVGRKGTGRVVQSGGDLTLPSQLRLGDEAGASGEYVLSQGAVSSGGTFIGASGIGDFMQTGGSHTARFLTLGAFDGSTGEYTISDGMLATTSPNNGVIEVGRNGSGAFTQTGGAVAAARSLFVGRAGAGTYSLGGGSLSAAGSFVGSEAVGTFVHSDGSHETSFLTLGSSAGAMGTYTMSGGVLTTTAASGVLEIGRRGIGMLTQTGGDTTTSGDIYLGRYAGSMGTLEVSGSATLGAATGLYIGHEGSGSVQHSGGMVSVGGDLVVASNAGSMGSYTINGAGTALTVGGTLNVGRGGMATFSHMGGAVTAGNLIVGDRAGSNGELFGRTMLQTTGDAVIGQKGTGRFVHGQSDTVDIVGGLTIGAASGSFGRYDFVTLGDALGGRLMTGEAVIGRKGEGQFSSIGQGATAQRHFVTGDMHIGRESGSDGRYTMTGQANLHITGDVHISAPWHGTGPLSGAGAMENHSYVTPGGVTVNPLIEGDFTSTIYVHGSRARLTGAADYQVRVRYESDARYGAAQNQPVDVFFDRAQLTRGSVLNVGQGLTTANVGLATDGQITAQEKVAWLNGSTLAGSRFHMDWGDPSYAHDINYVEQGQASDGAPTVSVPFSQAEAQGAGSVQDGAVLSRLRLMQIGSVLASNGGNANSPLGDKAGQVRNITSVLNTTDGLVFGDTWNLEGSADLAIVGRAVKPRHQDPAIQTLHGAQYGLTGAGVVVGQLELGLAYAEHGCFDDWTTSDPDARRISYIGDGPASNQSSPHATAVASIIAGFDPLGLQVDGQSRVLPAPLRYNQGRGFTGVAPGAEIVGHRVTTDSEFAGQLDALRDAGSKVINMSFGQFGAQGGQPNGGTASGDTLKERAVDRLVDTDGVIVVVAAGNNGPNAGTMTSPAGAYNAIAVGNAEFDRDPFNPNVDTAYPVNFDVAHASVDSSSSHGPTNEPNAANRRAKPDLVAQGVANMHAFSMEQADQATGGFNRDPAYPEWGDRGLYSTKQRINLPTLADRAITGTSFAAPMVSGVAALMVQEAGGAGAVGADPRVVKSILQTSAWKPASWEKGATDGGVDDSTAIPLSYEWGAGLLNPVGAVSLLRAGQPTDTMNITGPGWTWSMISSSDTSGIFDVNNNELTGDVFIMNQIQPASVFTATLNWNRSVNSALEAAPLVDLDLQLYTLDENSQWGAVANWSSASPVDNVEHIWIPQNAGGSPLLARVFIGSSDPNVADLTYAFSWAFTAIPAPSVWSVTLLFGAAASRRRRGG